MAANELSFEQIADVLNAVTKQVTGAETIAPVNTNEFITDAQTTLKTGYGQVAQAISQVLSETIFSIRPYYEKFQSLRRSNQKWGNMVRKINYCDSDFVDNPAYEIVNGQSVDHYKVRLPEVVQTNFYGQDVWKDFTTITMDQMDDAFSGPDQFGNFLSGQLSNIADRHSQARETLARMAIANFISGKTVADEGSIIHLLTEYNALTGLKLSAQDVYKPDNFISFIQWVYSRVAQLSSLLTERSAKFHMNIAGKTIPRHTPQQMQNVYITADSRFQIDARVLADRFHDNYLTFGNVETVNFWQSIDTPKQIITRPGYISEAGAVVNATEDVTVNNIFGCILDDEAVGYNVSDEKALNTPINAAGEYYDIWWSFRRRYINDFTENGVVLLLD